MTRRQRPRHDMHCPACWQWTHHRMRRQDGIEYYRCCKCGHVVWFSAQPRPELMLVDIDIDGQREYNNSTYIVCTTTEQETR